MSSVSSVFCSHLYHVPFLRIIQLIKQDKVTSTAVDGWIKSLYHPLTKERILENVLKAASQLYKRCCPKTFSCPWPSDSLGPPLQTQIACAKCKTIPLRAGEKLHNCTLTCWQLLSMKIHRINLESTDRQPRDPSSLKYLLPSGWTQLLTSSRGPS